jgi:hypothetical protein
LPGKPGYTYTRPFDHFSFQATASSANGAENLMTRGLLFGKGYESSANYRGVWGLYGSYDYIAPQTYRVSSTALSLGTTGQWWLSDSIAAQATAMTGVGYAAVGTTHSTSDNDYHYGLAPQALLALRFIFGERAAIDLTGREYFVSRVAAADRGGTTISPGWTLLYGARLSAAWHCATVPAQPPRRVYPTSATARRPGTIGISTPSSDTSGSGPSIGVNAGAFMAERNFRRCDRVRHDGLPPPRYSSDENTCPPFLR